jgi:hypothetical protein
VEDDMERRTLLRVSLLAAAWLAPGTLWGQVAETEQLSERAVVLEVWANAVPLTLRIPDGEMARISDAAGATFGLTPRLTATGATLHLFVIDETGRGGERMREVEQLPVVPGVRAHFGPHAIQLEAMLVRAVAMKGRPQPRWRRNQR